MWFILQIGGPTDGSIDVLTGFDVTLCVGLEDG